MFRITENRKLEWNDELDIEPGAFYLKLTGKTFEGYAGGWRLLPNECERNV